MASNQNSNDDLTLVWLAIIVGSLLLGGYFLGPYFRQGWLYLVQFESYLLLATTFDDGLRAQAWAAIDWAHNTHRDAISLTMYTDVRHEILRHGNHNYIALVALALLSYRSYRHFDVKGYQGLPTVEGLIATEKKIWPTLEFLYLINPLKLWEDELRGPGRYPVMPFAHAAENGYLVHPEAGSKHQRRYDENIARAVMLDQLGDEFDGFQKMPLFYQLVMTIVASHECQNRHKLNGWLREFAITLAAVQADEKDNVIQRVSELVTPVMALLDDEEYSGPIDNNLTKPLLKQLESEHRKVLKERKKDKFKASISSLEVIRSMRNGHAYNTTLLVASLQNAKRKGKLPPGRLVFLKPWDRKLFLLVSNTPYYVANPSQRFKFVSGFVTEVVGVFSHLQHEYYCRKALKKPYLDSAIVGVRKRLEFQNLIAKEVPNEQ